MKYNKYTIFNGPSAHPRMVLASQMLLVLVAVLTRFVGARGRVSCTGDVCLYSSIKVSIQLVPKNSLFSTTDDPVVGNRNRNNISDDLINKKKLCHSISVLLLYLCNRCSVNMTLTTVIGSSGSGKTTFLNDVYKSHKCIYIRQFHIIRPYLIVKRIPRFDPTKLPYWDIYIREKKDETIQVGGTMAGIFLPGLSGGQRKLFLFELICQRILSASKNDLLVVLDEPFAGVTDDFVPFISERLREISARHNILVVTNDHVDTLTKLANNTITVSAVDRQHVRINQNEKVDRTKAIAALGLGGTYENDSTKSFQDDVRFFLDIEVYHNKTLLVVSIFIILIFILFVASFWDSNESITALIVVGSGLVAFFSTYPSLMALVDWRNAVIEEAEALVHGSKSINKLLKVILIYVMIVIVTAFQYTVVNIVLDGMRDVQFWVAMLFDFIGLTFYLVAFGLYSSLPFEFAQILGVLPIIFMIFFSTTFSPGSGLPGLKQLRYLFPRFYFWCMLPGVGMLMEGCPEDPTLNIVYLILSSFFGIFGFIIIKIGLYLYKNQQKKNLIATKRATLMDDEFQLLLIELYGEIVLERLQQLRVANNNSTTGDDDIIYETKDFIEDGKIFMEL